jgi:hypothetical protein
MTSAELLELFNDLTGRAATDVILDTKKYTWLARAEKEVISELAGVAPWVLYPKVGTANLPQLVTVDNNVFTFGLDADDQPIVPFGDVQIYRKVSDVPDRPLQLGWDYLSEVSQIRFVRNRKYTGPLYYRGIVMPAKIAADENPHLLPTDANELTAIRAAKNFAESGNLRNTALADRMRLRQKERWPYWCLVWKRQFTNGGALSSFSLKDLVTPLL